VCPKCKPEVTGCIAFTRVHNDKHNYMHVCAQLHSQVSCIHCTAYAFCRTLLNRRLNDLAQVYMWCLILRHRQSLTMLWVPKYHTVSLTRISMLTDPMPTLLQASVATKPARGAAATILGLTHCARGPIYEWATADCAELMLPVQI